MLLRPSGLSFLSECDDVGGMTVPNGGSVGLSESKQGP